MKSFRLSKSDLNMLVEMSKSNIKIDQNNEIFLKFFVNKYHLESCIYMKVVGYENKIPE